MTLMLLTTPWNHFVLQAEADIRPSVFSAHDDQVHAGPLGFEAGQVLDGAEIGEEVEFLAQRDVDALEASTIGVVTEVPSACHLVGCSIDL